MGPIQVVVTDANNLILEVTPTAETSIVLDRGVAGPTGMVWEGNWSSATAYNVNDAVYYAAGNASYICILANTNQLPTNATYWQLLVSGAGNVTGAASSTDNAVVRFDGTTGKLIQNSLMTIADDGTTVVNSSSSTNAFRVTHTGTGNALLIEDSATIDSTPFVIDAFGRAILGSTAPVTYSTTSAITPSFQVNAAGSIASGISRFSANTAANAYWFLKSRGTTIGSYDVVVSGDSLGTLGWLGADGTEGIQAATITAAVDGTPGTSDMPGRLVFSTTADGAAAPTERMRINSSGYVGIGTSAPSVNLEVSSATGSATPTPTEIRISTTTDTSGFSTTLPWSRLSFYSADLSDTGPKIQGAVDMIADTSTGGRSSMVFKSATATTGTLTERMRITAAGNVGIGTASPAYPLDVTGQGRATTGFAVSTDGSAFTPAGLNAIPNYGLGYITSTSNSTLSGFGGLSFYTNQVQRVRFDQYGNVGIGTNTPQSKLDVLGDIRLSDTSATIFATNLKLQSNELDGGTNINIRPSGSGNFAGVECQNTSGFNFTKFSFGVQSSNTGYISGDFGGSGSYGDFHLTLGGGTGGMYWTTQGDVGFGTTSPVNRSGFRGITGNGANGSFVTLQGNNTSYGEILADVNGVQVTSVAAKPIILKTNDTDRVTIDSAGSTYIETGNLWQYAPAPTSKAAVSTLTAAELFTGILNTTGTTYTVTVPTGTNIDAFYPQVPATNIGFDFYIINTATGTITIAVNTGVTALGALTIPTATSAMFRFRRTAANTYVMYRLR